MVSLELCILNTQPSTWYRGRNLYKEVVLNVVDVRIICIVILEHQALDSELLARSPALQQQHRTKLVRQCLSALTRGQQRAVASDSVAVAMAMTNYVS